MRRLVKSRWLLGLVGVASVAEALLEYIQRRKQRQIVELFGKVDWDPGYDYKKQRRRK